MRLCALRRMGLAALACCAPLVAGAQDVAPLTLSQALAAADAPHPDLRLAEADRAAALAEQDLALSRRDWNVNLEAGLRRARPSTGPDRELADNNLKVNVRKNLYDFGRTSLAESAAKAMVEAREANLMETRDRRRIEIMARFFDVLVADLQYTADNEFMAVAYVNFDNGRDRFKVGQISAVDLAELEYRYQESLVKRNASQVRQRTTRARLAAAMNRPERLPAELEDPKLPGNDRTLPEYEALLPLLEDNPRMRAQKNLLAASRHRLEALRAENSPTLDAELEAADYSRETISRDDLRAGVVLTWPLYQGRRISAQLAREQAQFHKLQAEADKLRLDLAQALLEVWLEIGQLQRTVREAAKKQVDFRDLALEKARGQYEVELKANLGDSMAATMEAKLRQRNNEYQLALAFARLEALLGRPLEDVKDDGKGQPK
jgi:outer membrane protein TolC